ncbi:hypothetical protein VFPPC_16042 [Pochonia chlamydosporia 170]|uniref:Uncharacterized protein n=1 Tax=Pochonia chlamydosporia 170 TaxID=1380566 RepID=A0A179FND8_METCM|nr:hypothetical protein VFPPC_16042 [Pochonia chlamydosporia 170]OAQ66529.1 hypothetical protein VFPPC_16042 [Pochonia chlamydosporia 170]
MEQEKGQRLPLPASSTIRICQYPVDRLDEGVLFAVWVQIAMAGREAKKNRPLKNWRE